jgi:hypothetical protein
MIRNKFRTTEKPPVSTETPQAKGKSIFSMIDAALKLDERFADGLPLQYLPKTLFVIGLTIFYIANSHFAEKTTRRIDKLKSEVEDLRADYTTQKASYMYDSKQSEVARKVAIADIKENVVPPFKITLKKGEY